MLRGSIPVTILDVSRSGFKLQLRTGVRAGTMCELRATLDGIRLVAQVRIIRCSATGVVADGVGGRTILYTAGASIAHLDEDGTRELGSWLAGLSDACLSADAVLAASPAFEVEELRAPASRTRPKLVRDVMNTSVLTVRENLTLTRLMVLFAARHIAGAPVVDGDGKLAGIVTAQLIFAKTAKHRDSDKARKPGRRGKRAEPEQEAAPETVRDVMASASACAIPDELTVDEAADVMIARRMNRLLVVREEKVVGFVDAVDLLEAWPRKQAEPFGEAIELLVVD